MRAITINKSSKKLREAMWRLRRTPIHPQWLVLRAEAANRAWISGAAHGLVLDIGCADCRMRSWLHSCEYIGIDYPVTAEGLYKTTPDVFADGAALPISDASADTVLLLEVLEHVGNATQVLDEIARVLKPGGLLLLSVPFLYPLHDAPHDHRRYTGPGLEAAIRQSGLNPEQAKARNPGFESTALLASIACAEAVLMHRKNRSWHLVFAPFLLSAVPIINICGWALARVLGSGELLASGHSIEARKPTNTV